MCHFMGWTWDDESSVRKSISHIDRRSHSIPMNTLNSVCLHQLLKFKTDIVNDSVELLLFGVPLKMTFVNDYYYYDYIVSSKNKSLCLFRLILFVSDDCHRLVSICTPWTRSGESLCRMQQKRQQSMILFSTRALCCTMYIHLFIDNNISFEWPQYMNFVCVVFVRDSFVNASILFMRV